MLRLLGAVFVGLIVIGALVSYGKQEDQKRDVQRAATDPSTAVSVSADQLQADYAANEVRADNLYRGKVLRVTGAVQAIKKDIADDPYLAVWTRNEFMPVHAEFDQEGALGELRAGQRVTIRCIGNNVILGSPILKHCALE